MLKHVLGCSKATLFPLDFHTVKLTTSKLNRERKKCVHQIEIVNQRDHSSTTVAALCREEKDLCKEPLFDNIKDVKNDLIVSEDGTKLAILVRQSKRRGGPSFIIQAEFGAKAKSSDSKAKAGDASVQAHAALHSHSSTKK